MAGRLPSPDRVAPPSPAMLALGKFLADRPALQYALEAEVHRLWGGRPLFEASPSQADPPGGEG